MRTLLLGLILLSSFSFAQSEVNLRNDREGESVYATHLNKFKIKSALKKISKEEIVDIYRGALLEQEDKKLCSYDLNSKIQNTLSSKGHRGPDLENLIYVLRQENEIDDVVARILINAHKVQTTLPLNKDEEYIVIPENNEKTEELLKIITSFSNRFLKNTCFDEAYRSMYNELLKKNKRLKPIELEGLYHKARRENRIDDKIFLMLQQGLLNELEKGGLTLAAYYQKITMLRTQYPLRDSGEKSQFVTEKIKKIKLTRRQKLYESYTDLQIIMMGNIIKTLRSDLESPKIEILVYSKDPADPVRREELQPMERFRFAIKFLRKQMALLANNTYFAGRTPDYLDLMVASYEIGIIPASELEEIAGLEDIWNPKKTGWEKALVWTGTFASIATLVIPPPYGFIPALAVVVIQATTQTNKKGQNSDDPTSLF